MPGTSTNIVPCSSTLFLGMNAWHAAKSSSIAPACLLMWEIQERVRTPILHAFVPASEEVQKLEDEDRENYRMLKSKGWHSSKAFLPMIRVCGTSVTRVWNRWRSSDEGQMAQSHPSQRSSFWRFGWILWIVLAWIWTGGWVCAFSHADKWK